jgi:AcrR family transcriptional regulator
MPVRSSQYMDMRREEILAAALECVRRLGIAGVSLKDICEQAGISKGALYTHFSSKSEVLIALLQQQRGRVVDSVRFASADELRAMLQRMIVQIDRGRASSENMVDLDVVVVSRHDPAISREIRRTARERSRALAASVAGLRARGEIREGVSDEAVVALLEVMVAGMVHHAALQSASVAKRYRAMMELALDLLAPC